MIADVGLEQLDAFAIRFWKFVGDKNIFAFHGGMGAGKTTTISALCKAKGVEDVTGSPTFSIINEYAFMENGAHRQLFHIDLYRLKNMEEVIAAGVEDCLYSGALCFVEWPEKAPGLFDEQTVHVVIEVVNEQQRVIKILSATEFDSYTFAEQL